MMKLIADEVRKMMSPLAQEALTASAEMVRAMSEHDPRLGDALIAARALMLPSVSNPEFKNGMRELNKDLERMYADVELRARAALTLAERAASEEGATEESRRIGGLLADRARGLLDGMAMIRCERKAPARA